MNADIGEALREGIERLEPDAPRLAGLARRARKAHRSRGLAIRAAAVGGTTLLAAAAVTISLAGAPGPARGPRPPVYTDAYLTRRIERALAAADRRGYVVRTLTGNKVAPQSWAGGTPPGYPGALVVGDYTMTWTYQGRLSWRFGWYDGRLLFTAGFAAARGRSHRQAVEVDYQTRTWWQAPLAAAVPYPFAVSRRSCAQGVGVFALQDFQGTSIDWPAWIRHALRCGWLRPAGHQLVHGVRMLRLEQPPAPGGANNPAHYQSSAVVLLDPASYLPFRLTLSWTGGGTVTKQEIDHQITNFAWLPPTRDNIAKTYVVIPHGFREVAPPNSTG